MARYRTFKPELFADEKLTECSVDARFLFLGLLPFLDDMGRRQYHPRRIKAEVFPADDEYTVGVVEGLVQELAKVGVIELYDVGNKHYIRVPNFLRHQNINRPTHCYVPPSPSEGLDAPKCKCENCKRHPSNSRPQSTSFQNQHLNHSVSSTGMPENFQVLTEHSLNTHGVLTEDSVNTHFSSVVESKGVISQNQHQHQGSSEHKPFDSPQQSEVETNQENRRARQRALDGIATQILVLLKVQANPLLLEAVTKSITVKARTRNTSVELAGQHILAKAALYAVESPPEDWRLWFEDVRYDYVPQGDKRINNGRFEARPVCGGSRCSDGWEMVKVGDSLRLRRCPDCEQLWRDMGV